MTIDKSFFADKKICVLGDRDGIPGPAMSVWKPLVEK